MAKTDRTTRRKTSLPKLIEKYYADLADLAKQNVLFEMGVLAEEARWRSAGPERP